MGFGTRLKSIRKRNKMLQQELAQIIGVSRQAVAFYEAGRREPKYEILIKIADFFNVSLDYLLDRNNYSFNNDFKNIKNNIKKIMGEMTCVEFSKDIGDRLGILVSTEKIQMYIDGKTTPDSITLKIFALYAKCDQKFFYTSNE